MMQDNFNCERTLMSNQDLETKSQIKFQNKIIIKVSCYCVRSISLVTDVFLNKSDFFGRPSENVSKRFHVLCTTCYAVSRQQTAYVTST